MRRRGEAVIYLPRLILLLAVLAVIFASRATAQDKDPSVTAVSLGFADNYKVGSWTPVEVEIKGGKEPLTGIVTVNVPDGDGVPTTIASTRPVAIEPGKATTSRLFVRPGQSYGSLRVQVLTTEGKEATSKTFFSGMNSGGNTIAIGLPATNRLIVEFGPPLGLGEFIVNENPDELSQARLARIDDAADLPTEWYGYESVDMVVLSTSRPDLYRSLAQNPARREALRRWVEMGGKLVIFCGAEADELLSDDGALSGLIPGTFVESVTLEQSQEIEGFSGADQSITPTRRVSLSVPVFKDIRGSSLLSAKRGETEIPLVIRSPLGFGELTFVGLDFDQAPFLDWPGRKGFLTKVFNLTASGSSQQQSAGIETTGSDDLVTQVRTTLDLSFTGVEVIPFALVAVLVVGYILLIGPGDYFLVNKFFKRPEVTWISFPLMVAAVSAGAYFFANWQKGDELRVNQVEFVDTDAATGLTRGTVWTHFFTPQVGEFDLSIEPAYLGEKVADSQEIVAWLGQPGYGLGGMQGGGQSNLFERGYSFAPQLEEMFGVPVQLWSTKTITARWSMSKESPVESKLARTDDQLLEGQVINNGDVALEDCVLLYGQWAWNAGTLNANSALNVADIAQPRTVRTLLTSATAGDTTITDVADDGTVPYRLANTDITRLAKAIMFFRAINGERYTGSVSQYQAFLDMSHLLDQPDLAVLVGRSKAPASQWLDGDKPLGKNDDGNDQNLAWTYYRYVVPVGPLVVKD
jgi:hypothetical protein